MNLYEYTEVLQKIDETNSQMLNCRNAIKMKQGAIKQSESELNKLNAEKDNALASERQTLRLAEIQARQKPIVEERTRVSTKLEDARKAYTEDIKVISVANYNARKEASFIIINECLDTCDMLRDKFDPMLTEGIIQGVLERVERLQISDAMIANLNNDVKVSIGIVETKTSSPMLEKIATKLFIPKVRKNKKSSSLFQMISLGAKTVLLLGVTAYVPVLFIIPFSGFILKGVNTETQNIKELSRLLYPYQFLKEISRRYRTEMLEECEQLRQDDLQLREQLFKEEETSLLESLNSLEEQYNEVTDLVDASFDNERTNSLVEQQFTQNLNIAKIRASRNRDALDEQNKELLRMEQSLIGLRTKKAELKLEIEESLINLNSVGTSQLLLQSFFLGFDESERLIELAYDGDTSVIMYTGDDSKVVVPFITMVIIQYFSNMMPNSLHIDIVDLDNGGINYDIFRIGELSTVISIIASSDSESQLIEILSQDMRTRSERISAHAESIDEYNKIMLARDSIPMDYRIVIFQTISDSIMTNQKFLQLCRQGSKNGIIPLIFVNSDSMPRIEIGSDKGVNEENIVKWRNFIYAIPNQFFNYNSSSGEVTNLGDDFKTESLAVFNSILRGE